MFPLRDLHDRDHDFQVQGRAGLSALHFVEHRQEVHAHGRVRLQTLPLLLEGGVGPRPQSRDAPGGFPANPDSKFTTLNLPDPLFAQAMEVEEAVIVGLLAVGMSVLVALTIMVFW